MILRYALAFFFLVTSSAALAGGGTQVPEGSQFTLFALGVLGVIVGRRLAMRRPGED